MKILKTVKNYWLILIIVLLIYLGTILGLMAYYKYKYAKLLNNIESNTTKIEAEVDSLLVEYAALKTKLGTTIEISKEQQKKIENLKKTLNNVQVKKVTQDTSRLMESLQSHWNFNFRTDTIK